LFIYTILKFRTPETAVVILLRTTARKQVTENINREIYWQFFSIANEDSREWGLPIVHELVSRLRCQQNWLYCQYIFVKYTFKVTCIICNVEIKTFIGNCTFNALQIKLFRPKYVVINCFLMFLIEFRRKYYKYATNTPFSPRYSWLTPWHSLPREIMFCLLAHNCKHQMKPLTPILGYWLHFHLFPVTSPKLWHPMKFSNDSVYTLYITLIQLCATCPAPLILLVIILLLELWIVKME
jgi:hypothetical protein